jgi:hypothetical protein
MTEPRTTARTHLTRSGPRRNAGVIDVRVHDGREARKTIVNALVNAETGTHVRLAVGRELPPLWLREQVRHDLDYQVVARDAAVLGAWTFELNFGGAL